MRISKSKLLVKSFLALTSCLLLSGCSILRDDPKAPSKEPEIYRVASRKLPPEPVYNKVRAVHLPITYPSYVKPEAGALDLPKNLTISVKNIALEQVANALADSSKYSAYTASAIASKKVSLKSYGDLDQIAADLAKVSSAHVVVDHQNREIRVLENDINIDTKAKFALAE